MNRRDFINSMAAGAAVCAGAPLLPARTRTVEAEATCTINGKDVPRERVPYGRFGESDGEYLQRRINECPAGGTITIPDGTYTVHPWELVSKPGQTIRGSGKGETILRFIMSQ